MQSTDSSKSSSKKERELPSPVPPSVSVEELRSRLVERFRLKYSGARDLGDWPKARINEFAKLFSLDDILDVIKKTP